MTLSIVEEGQNVPSSLVLASAALTAVVALAFASSRVRHSCYVRVSGGSSETRLLELLDLHRQVALRRAALYVRAHGEQVPA